jgi:hypothetical protein
VWQQIFMQAPAKTLQQHNHTTTTFGLVIIKIIQETLEIRQVVYWMLLDDIQDEVTVKLYARTWEALTYSMTGGKVPFQVQYNGRKEDNNQRF